MTMKWCGVVTTLTTIIAGVLFVIVVVNFVVNVDVTMLNQKKNESLLFPAKSTAPLASKAAPPKQKTDK